MGTEGMKGSLVSREVIADSIETVCFAESMDSLVIVGGCDKNMPGAVMAIARLDLPSIFFYGGTILPGHHRGRDVTIQDVYEVYGELTAGTTSLEDLIALEKVPAPARDPAPPSTRRTPWHLPSRLSACPSPAHPPSLPSTLASTMPRSTLGWPCSISRRRGSRLDTS